MSIKGTMTNRYRDEPRTTILTKNRTYGWNIMSTILCCIDVCAIGEITGKMNADVEHKMKPNKGPPASDHLSYVFEFLATPPLLSGA